MGRLDGKVAIVTGGASGIGEGAAIRLAEDGAQVVVADRNLEGAEAVARRIGGKAFALGFDAEDIESTQALVEQVVEECGRIDVLNNNAAWTSDNIGGLDRDLLNTTPETFDKAWHINVRSIFVACKAAVPHMIAQGGGSIVNMASVAGVRGGSGAMCYGVTKAAVLRLTTAVATQYGRKNVRSNAILPGFIGTPATLVHVPDSKALMPFLPFHRDGKPADTAALIAFLASDEAEYINGQCIAVDGGYLAGDARPSRLEMD
ncbi:SDR family NAD(P)-dependent oxidoreductase [Novosphingobium pentaromativorans]|nr:SDR family oxidoreductase [Novosphingobium pentaromativorans]